MYNIAAERNGNKMLEAYHKGAYGSRQPDEWSCCKRKGRDQSGCAYTADDKDVPGSVHLTITTSTSNSSSGESNDLDHET